MTFQVSDRRGSVRRQWPLRLKAVVGLMVCLAAVGACSAGSGAASSSSGNISIAVEAPLTGSQASYGSDILDAVQLAAKRANAKGGILGKKITIVPADDQADPKQGADVAQRLTTQHVFAEVGPFNSSVGVVVLPIYKQHGIIAMHLTSSVATNGEGFTAVPKDFQIGPVEANAIEGFFKANRIAIIYDQSTYTSGIASSLQKVLTDSGRKIVAYEGIQEGLTDYSAVLTKIKAANPDLMYVSTYYPEGGLIAREARSIGVPGTYFMGLAVQDAQFPKIAGLAVARSVYSSGVPSPDEFPAAKSFNDAFAAEFGRAPGTWSTFAYDNVELLFNAVRQAGSWDTARVESALKATRSFAGVTGSISIDPATGNRMNPPLVVLDVDANGQFVIDPKWAKWANFTQ